MFWAISGNIVYMYVTIIRYRWWLKLQRNMSFLYIPIGRARDAHAKIMDGIYEVNHWPAYDWLAVLFYILRKIVSCCPQLASSSPIGYVWVSVWRMGPKSWRDCRETMAPVVLGYCCCLGVHICTVDTRHCASKVKMAALDNIWLEYRVKY